MNPTAPAPRLRVYGFAAALSIAIMVALLVLPRYTRGARYLEPQAALLQYMVERWSLKQPTEFAEVDRADRAATPRQAVAVRRAAARSVRTNVDPPLEPAERRRARDARRRRSGRSTSGRIVVRSDDGSLIGVYASEPTRLPVGLRAADVRRDPARRRCGARSGSRDASRVRSISSRPRRASSVKATSSARARLDRDDELGDVGQAFDEMAERTAARDAPGAAPADGRCLARAAHAARADPRRARARGRGSGRREGRARRRRHRSRRDRSADRRHPDHRAPRGRRDRADRSPADAISASSPIARSSGSPRKHPRRKLDRDDRRRRERELECDPVLLRRAVDNLLDNAAKYSDARRRTVALAVIPNGDARRVRDRRSRHRDVARTISQRAFTPFWRADGSRTRKTGGVGLGLALARRIARVARRRRHAAPRLPGKGTTARLEVPLVHGRAVIAAIRGILLQQIAIRAQRQL